MLGNGMLTSEGPHWKRQRRIAQPAFHGERVRRFAPILSRMAAECADEWESAARSGRTVDACADMMRVTLRAVAETLFGDDLGASAAEINRVFPTILACLAARIASPVRTPLWLPQLWSDPEAFLPERFEPGGEEQRNKFAYLPFGAGPRICLGASFAMIESQIIAGTLLARFRARLADPAPVMPQPQVTLRPSHPVELRLERAPLA